MLPKKTHLCSGFLNFHLKTGTSLLATVPIAASLAGPILSGLSLPRGYAVEMQQLGQDSCSNSSLI